MVDASPARALLHDAAAAQHIQIGFEAQPGPEPALVFQEELLRLLEDANKTVNFVTHSIEEAVYVSDQIVLLSPGPGRISDIIIPAVERESMTADQIRATRATWILRAYLADAEKVPRLARLLHQDGAPGDKGN